MSNINWSPVSETRPRNHPFMLYEVVLEKEDGVKRKWVVAETMEHASELVNLKGGVASPFLLVKYIQRNGHRRTNKFLKKFGDSWVAKNGKVYYSDPY